MPPWDRHPEGWPLAQLAKTCPAIAPRPVDAAGGGPLGVVAGRAAAGTVALVVCGVAACVAGGEVDGDVVEAARAVDAIIVVGGDEVVVGFPFVVLSTCVFDEHALATKNTTATAGAQRCISPHCRTP